MKVGLFGGSFDPIHRGHIEPVRQACRDLALDRVYYLPTAQPPHKSERRFAPALARFAMVELALLHDPQLLVSTFELTLGRRAYTVDTVEHFRRQLPSADLFLIIGADSYRELDTWRRWRDLVEMVTLVVLRRPGSEVAVAGGVIVLDNAPLDVSSTELRERLRQGDRSVDGLIPEAVLDYVRKYSLYQ